MIGPTKLSTIREHVRISFNMTDPELLAWFNRQLEDRKQKPKVAQTEIDTLRLLRDALEQEAKRSKPKRKPPRVSAAKS